MSIVLHIIEKKIDVYSSISNLSFFTDLLANYLILTVYTISIKRVQISLILYIFRQLHALVFAWSYLEDRSKF